MKKETEFRQILKDKEPKTPLAYRGNFIIISAVCKHCNDNSDHECYDHDGGVIICRRCGVVTSGSG